MNAFEDMLLFVQVMDSRSFTAAAEQLGLSKQYVSRRLMQLEGRPDTDWFSPHALRRACATHNYERGVDLVAIQQLLGHWTVSSTMRYVRPSATFIEDAYRRAVTSTLDDLSGEDGTA